MSVTATGPQIDYYFSCISSFAYIGHAAFQELADKLSLDVTYKPVQLGKVFAGSGGLAMGDRDPARLRNRLLELRRWRDFRGIEMNVEPKFFPTNPTLADCVVIAVQEEGRNPADLMLAIMRKIWIEDVNIAERDVIADCLTATGEDANFILARAESDAMNAIYDANSASGLENDIIGSPCVVYQGEPFWGQDRFDLLEAAITSGRPAYSGVSSAKGA